MKVLIVGNKGGAGGREHALGVALAASADVSEVYFAPDNGGTMAVGKSLDVQHDQLPDWAAKNNINLVVVGPEAPLVEGLADRFRAKGLNVCGASKVAAQLEGSKTFAFEFMEASKITQPPSQVVANEEEGLAAIAAMGGPNLTVIKADGLAGGKGVFLPESDEDAKTALERIFAGEVDAVGSKVVIQKRMNGPEASVFVLSDGKEFYIIPVAAQDHKRLLDGDKGPNTGGMGAYAPVPESILNKSQWQKVHEIAIKTIEGMEKNDTPYQGILYIGLMLAEELNGDPLVIEYNVRFGDPEAQVLIPLLTRAGVNMYKLLAATATPGDLAHISLPQSLNEAALTVVLAAHGYPESPRKGDVIEGLGHTYENAEIYQAGTTQEDEAIISSGGRVLAVTGFGKTISDAAEAAYNAIGSQAVYFADMQYRKDIGYQAR
jgi:phosphoribosylamine---glycine ligase